MFLAGYFGGRTFEYFANKWYFKRIINTYAMHYNITDAEIDDIHFKMNERILIKNKEDAVKKATGTLDNVKFRV